MERLAPWVLGAAVFLACFFFTPRESPFVSVPKPGAGRHYFALQSLLDSGTNPLGFLSVAVLSAVAAVMARDWSRRWLLYAMAVIAWLLFALWPVLFAATYGTVFRFRSRSELIWYLIAASVFICAPFLFGDNFSELPSRERLYALGLFISVSIVTPALTGLWMRTRRQKFEVVLERNAGLQAEQEARQQQARAEERNRIAHDMHDVVANRIALIVMHAGAIQLGTEKNGEVAKAATLITSLGRTTLTELRDVLGVLRRSATSEETGPTAYEQLSSRLEKLVEQARAAGLDVEYHVEGKTLEAPAAATRIARELAAYRVAQEALTNVMKHARGAKTVMTMRRIPNWLEIVVENEPPPRRRLPETPLALPGSGLGQVGSRERITVLNGQFEAKARPDGGYVVRAVLPDPPPQS